MPSIHPDISDQLLSFLDRRLNEHNRRQVQEHLASCVACSEELAAIRVVTAALRQAGLDSRVAGGAADRYGCAGPEELCSYEPGDGAGHVAGGNDWIARHLEACTRCQHEIDLVHLMRRELQDATSPVSYQDLSASVEARLMARVRQGGDAGSRRSLLGWLPPFGVPLVARAALGVGLVAAVAVWAVFHLRSGPVQVAQRPSEQEARPAQPSVSSPGASQQESQALSGTKRGPTPAVSEPASPRISSPTPPLVARVEPPAPAPPAVPSVTVAPPATEQAKGVTARPSAGPGLPPLVPARHGESLKILVLPVRGRPGLRSRVASALQDQLEPVQPPDREFPAETSVDDLTANRRLGRLFGARYILEIGVRREASGYHLVLRAADADTGGVVATREGSAREEEELEPVAARLARDLRQQLRAVP